MNKKKSYACEMRNRENKIGKSKENEARKSKQYRKQNETSQ